MTSSRAYQKAIAVFRKHAGMLKTGQAIKLGIHPRTLYAMRDNGMIEQLARGLFRLTSEPPASEPDLVQIAQKVPNGVICLLSALSFHGLTTQVPHRIQVAILRGSEPPRMNHLPLQIVWFTGKAFSEGIERHKTDGTKIQVYSSEKTIADCFKFRNKIGLEIAVEALKFYRARKKMDVNAILRYAKICRVEKIMRPYLEAVL